MTVITSMSNIHGLNKLCIIILTFKTYIANVTRNVKPKNLNAHAFFSNMSLFCNFHKVIEMQYVLLRCKFTLVCACVEQSTQKIAQNLSQ